MHPDNIAVFERETAAVIDHDDIAVLGKENAAGIHSEVFADFCFVTPASKTAASGGGRSGDGGAAARDAAGWAKPERRQRTRQAWRAPRRKGGRASGQRPVTR